MNYDENHRESGRKSSLRAAMKRGNPSQEAEADAEGAIERLINEGTVDGARLAAHLEAAGPDFQNGFRLGLLAGMHRARRS
ncbi:hypothetical protein [uncultured Nocardioides sp.]|uniref:hypothetical protein n=1 Tax=uncultured Nocardioides sp. TaxID=198441 RepID=UPI002633BE99|nr:hypothetical protein [uncultured Nocardioides sp.]